MTTAYNRKRGSKANDRRPSPKPRAPRVRKHDERDPATPVEDTEDVDVFPPIASARVPKESK